MKYHQLYLLPFLKQKSALSIPVCFNHTGMNKVDLFLHKGTPLRKNTCKLHVWKHFNFRFHFMTVNKCITCKLVLFSNVRQVITFN